MQKPNNYDTTQIAGELEPIDLGGHKMVIKQVSKWYLLFQYNKTENNKIEFDKLIN